MASIKAVLRKPQNADGTYSLAIRITKDRKSTYLYLGHHIHEKDWDAKNQRVKKSYDNSVRFNNMIAKKLAEANDKLLELETNKTDTSARVIGNAYKASKEGTFFKQAALYIQRLKDAGKHNQLSADQPRIARFREFLKGSDINFSEIDPILIRKFQAYLKNTRKVTERTVVNHLVVIRTIYNQAINDKLVDSKYYPFGNAKGNIKIKFPETAKIGFSKEEIIAIEKVELDKYRDHARNLWLFSFYLAGMRVSDVLRLKWSDINNGRLYYTMGKNQKPGSLVIHEKALAILEKYQREGPKHDLVFPDLEKLDSLDDNLAVQEYIKVRTKRANINFQIVLNEAKVKTKGTMHHSRHSYAQLAGDTNPRILQEQYRHTSILTTMGYQGNFTHKDSDETLKSIIDF